MLCLPILKYLANYLIVLDVVYSFVNYNKFNRINLFLPKSKNAESHTPNIPDSTLNERIELETKSGLLDDSFQSELDYQINQEQNLKAENRNNQDSAKTFTIENLYKHAQSLETFINKINYCWEFEGLKDEALKVSKLFMPELSDGSSTFSNDNKTKLESQLSGLVDYNNLERRLEGLIIKHYDKFKENMNKLDQIMEKMRKIEPLEFELNTSEQDNTALAKKPRVSDLLLEKLKRKANLFKTKLTHFIGLFYSFPPKAKNSQASHGKKQGNENLSDILETFKILKEKARTLGSRMVCRNNITSDRSDAWRITFLGTGSRRATLTRGLSSIAFQPLGDKGPIWLFDCGEGTRFNLIKEGLSPLRVEKIFVTHLHGDHSLGLFAFLSQESRWGKIEIYGPQGISNMVNTVVATSTTTKHKYIVKEYLNIPFTPLIHDYFRYSANTLSSDSANRIKPDNNSLYNVFEALNVKITAFPIRHNIPTVGYIIQEGLIPGKTGKGRTVCLLQDTCDASLASKFVQYPDLLIHESTFSTVSLAGTKKLLSEQTPETLNEVELQENLKSCCCVASGLAKDLANTAHFIATKRIPMDLIKNLSDMKENQAMFSHGMISKEKATVIKYQLMLLFNMKKRIAFLENIIQSNFNLENSIKLLEYVDKFQANNMEGSMADLEEFWRNHIRNILNQATFLKRSNEDDVLTGMIEDIVWTHGHSTETMAGRLAGLLRAKRLVLTHFSSRIPGDNAIDSIMTMKRIEHNASKEMKYAAHNLFSDNSISDSKNPKWQCYKPMVIAAWDGLRIDIPPN